MRGRVARWVPDNCVLREGVERKLTRTRGLALPSEQAPSPQCRRLRQLSEPTARPGAGRPPRGMRELGQVVPEAASHSVLLTAYLIRTDCKATQ